jgi:hypothetical protein
MLWKPFLVGLLLSRPLFGQETPKPEHAVPSSVPPADLPGYELSGTPDEGLSFVVKHFPLDQGPDVDAMIDAEGERRCAPKIARVGSYDRMPGNITVNGQTVVGIARYERLILCTDPREPIAPVSNIFHPTPADESALLSTFNAYFRAFDAGDVDALIPLREGPPFPRKVLLEEIRRHKLQYGEQKRTILKTSWYPNPPEFHGGIFGEVLFSQPVSNTNRLCRAAMFYRRGEQDFVLTRVLSIEIDGPSKGTDDLQSCAR